MFSEPPKEVDFVDCDKIWYMLRSARQQLLAIRVNYICTFFSTGIVSHAFVLAQRDRLTNEGCDHYTPPSNRPHATLLSNKNPAEGFQTIGRHSYGDPCWIFLKLPPNNSVPGQATLYPGGTTLYPGRTNVYLGGTTLYPGKTTLYPGRTTLYPGGTTLYPGRASLYPGGTTLYHGRTTLYPSKTNLYLGGTTLYPGGTRVHFYRQPLQVYYWNRYTQETSAGHFIVTLQHWEIVPSILSLRSTVSSFNCSFLDLKWIEKPTSGHLETWIPFF
jgi:hypothetical protein